MNFWVDLVERFFDTLPLCETRVRHKTKISSPRSLLIGFFFWKRFAHRLSRWLWQKIKCLLRTIVVMASRKRWCLQILFAWRTNWWEARIGGFASKNETLANGPSSVVFTLMALGVFQVYSSSQKLRFALRKTHWSQFFSILVFTSIECFLSNMLVTLIDRRNLRRNELTWHTQKEMANIVIRQSLP